MKPRLGPSWGKAAAFFYGLFDFNNSSNGAGFYPTAQAGRGAPPVNQVASDSGLNVSPKSTLGISAAWACVWLIADTISTLPFILNKRIGPQYGAPAVDHPLYAILNTNPNSQMTACDFWAMMIASELLWGNGYAHIERNRVGEIVVLDPLRPEFVTVYLNPAGELRYSYYPPSLPPSDWGAGEIFHIKGHSVDGLVGLSPIEYARNSLGIARAADLATADTFKNGLRMGGFLTSDKILKPDQREQLRDSLGEFATGRRKSGSFMVLEGGLNFEALTMNPQDAQLLASRMFAVEDVCRWYGVPPVLIGHAAAGVTSWGTGIENLLLGWRSLQLRSRIRKYEMAVGRSLLPPLERAKFYLTIDTDDLLGADSAARAALNSTNSQNGVMTRNEIRAMEDLPPLPGGDILTVQSNLVPLDKLGQTPPAPPPASPPAQGLAA